METTTAIAIAVILVIAAAAGFLYRRRRSEFLKTRFGPEYEYAVHEIGDRARAEASLERRAARTKKYDIRPLPAGDRDAFFQQWRRIQTRFVDDPVVAVREADEIIGDVMRKSGYPMADFEQRTEDLSVDHPRVVNNYRAAHAIAVSSDQGNATTEDLRQAMVYYRELFDDLLEAQPRT